MFHAERLPLLVWALAQGLPQTVARWGVRRQDSPFRFKSLTEVAARAGLPVHLEWLRTRGAQQLTADVFEHAARGGDAPTVGYLFASECPIDERAARGAAEAGHLEVLKALRRGGAPWGNSACNSAAAAGQAAVLEWALAAGAPFSGEGIVGAAKRDLACLKLLVEAEAQADTRRRRLPGCDKKACEAAVEAGQLECLVLRQRGARWSPATKALAAEGLGYEEAASEEEEEEDPYADDYEDDDHAFEENEEWLQEWTAQKEVQRA